MEIKLRSVLVKKNMYIAELVRMLIAPLRLESPAKEKRFRTYSNKLYTLAAGRGNTSIRFALRIAECLDVKVEDIFALEGND